MFTKKDIETYFLAEKQESLVFLIIGIVAVITALVFFFGLKTSFYKGAAWPLVLIGIIQIVVGYTVYARSDKQRIDNVYHYDLSPDKLQQEEIPRMLAVNKSFVLYRWIQIICLITGMVLLFLYWKNEHRAFLAGLGLTLCIQAALMLGADYFAEKRAKVYTAGLQQHFRK
jgi:hypothetical protein